MSVLLYSPRFNWEQKRVSHDEVIAYLMNGWFISPYSAIREGKQDESK